MGLRTETKGAWFIRTEVSPSKVNKDVCGSCPEYSSETNECRQISGIINAEQGMRDLSFDEDLRAYFQRILDGPGKQCKNPDKLFSAVRQATEDLNKRAKEFEKVG